MFDKHAVNRRAGKSVHKHVIEDANIIRNYFTAHGFLILTIREMTFIDFGMPRLRVNAPMHGCDHPRFCKCNMQKSTNDPLGNRVVDCNAVDDDAAKGMPCVSCHIKQLEQRITNMEKLVIRMAHAPGGMYYQEARERVEAEIAEWKS